MPNPLSDRSAIKEYVENLFGQKSEGNLVIFERDLSGKRLRHFVIPYHNREIAFDLLANQPDDFHRYLAVALHDEQAYLAKTRKAETACVLPFLALDIDLASGVHAAQNLPADEERALQLLEESGLPAPSFVVHSGGGLYPIWQFEQPVRLQSAEDRVRASRLWMAWNERAKSTWERHNLKLDIISELARVLRVPGTFNPKTQPPRPVRILAGVSERVWTIEQLEEFVASSLESTGMNSQPSGGRTLADALRLEWTMEEDENIGKAAGGALSMMTACAFLRTCDENAEQLTEPQWKDAADLLVHIPEGKRYFHQLSARDRRYLHSETEAKLDYASKYGPKLCKTIASHHPECCKGCLLYEGGAIRTPVDLTRTQPGLSELQLQYVLDAKTGLFFNTLNGRSKTKEDFDRSFTRNMYKRQLASTAFRNSNVSCLVDEHDFLVGNTDLIVGSDGVRILNTWKDGGIAAAEGDPSIWLDHLRYMVPSDPERRWILQYLAHLVQRPALKIKSAILLQSQQGVGKNLLIQSLKRMFHDKDVRELYGGILGERWQADLGNARLIALDELQIDELKAAYNQLKRWATEETQSVERKGIDAFTVRTPRGIIIMTNSNKPMAIEHDDRRLFVCKVDAPKREDAYYKRLVDVGLSESSVAAFKHFLLEFDLSDFDANAAPPRTEAKEELIRASASVPEQIIMELRENGSAPFNRPVYLAEDVAWAVEERLKRPVTAQQITPILKRLGDRKRARKTSVPRPVGTPRRGYVWAWHDVERWMLASNDEVSAAFRLREQSLAATHMFSASGVQLAN